MKKKDAKTLFREKFENKIPQDSSATAEFKEYLKVAIKNHQGRKFDSKIQPADFSLQDLVFMIADFQLTKDYVELIFNAFVNYSLNLKDFDTFLTLLVKENQETKNEFRASAVNRLLKAKHAYIASAFYSNYLYLHVEKILLLIVNNISDITSQEALLTKIYHHLTPLLKDYLKQFTSFDDLPEFLQKEVKVIDEWLIKNSFSAEQRQNILLAYVGTFIEETLHPEKPAMFNKVIIKGKDIISIPIEYRDFCQRAIEEVLISSLKSLTETANSNFRFSQHRLQIGQDLAKQALWSEWHTEAGNFGKELLRSSVKKIIPNTPDEISKDGSKISGKELSGKETDSALLNKTNSTKDLFKKFNRVSANISSLASLTFRGKANRGSLMEEGEKDKEPLPSVAPRRNELDDTPAQEIISEIKNFINSLGTKDAKSAIAFLVNIIGRVEGMLYYREVLSIMRELYLKIKEKFGSDQEQFVIINRKCEQLLKNYKILIANDREKYRDYESFLKEVNPLQDKKLLEIVCFLNTDLLIDAISKEAAMIKGIDGILIFSARYSQPINNAISLVYATEPEKLQEYQKKLEATTNNNNGIYNTDNPIYASHFSTDEERNSGLEPSQTP